jgi:pimeloyl-ACP methyl ester carboxylesterase
VLAEKARHRLDEQHLAFGAPKNLLFVPGCMGSLISSHTLGGVWWIDLLRNRDKLNKLGLQPDGQTDIDPSYDLYPIGIDMVYQPFLVAVLQSDDFNHDVFPYDWRKKLTVSTIGMRNKITQMYADNKQQPVHIVAHSMGGLLTRATLAQYGDELWPKIGRIVFTATPHYGATLAACWLKFHLGNRDLMGHLLAKLIHPDTFRSLWGALSLIPAPQGIYPGTRDNDAELHQPHDNDEYRHPCANFNLYDINTWQLGLSATDTANLQRILDDTASFYRMLRDAHLGLDQNYRDRMAVIAGVGHATTFRIDLEQGVFKRAKRDSKREVGQPNRESDGTVPLASAVLEYVGTTRYIKGVHTTLPAMSQVYNDVFHWLRGEPMELSDTPQGALAQHLGELDAEMEYPNLVGPAHTHVLTEESELDTTEPDPADVASAYAQLEAGQLPPEFNLMRLF